MTENIAEPVTEPALEQSAVVKNRRRPHRSLLALVVAGLALVVAVIALVVALCAGNHGHFNHHNFHRGVNSGPVQGGPVRGHGPTGHGPLGHGPVVAPGSGGVAVPLNQGSRPQNNGQSLAVPDGTGTNTGPTGAPTDSFNPTDSVNPTDSALSTQ